MRIWACGIVAVWLGTAALAQSPAAIDLAKQGDEYFGKGDYAHAIEAYTNSIRLYPYSAKTFYGRGYAYYRSHENDRAIQDYTEAIRLAPDYGEAFRERAHMYDEKSDYTRAIQDYTQAIHIKRGDFNLLYERAYDEERSGQYQAAIADLTEVLRRFPKATDAYRNRGRVWLYAAHLSEAQQDLSHAVELDPTGYYNVIWLHLARRKGGSDANDELTKNAARLNLTKWPGPIIELFLGKATADAVILAASDKDQDKRSLQQCEASFYIAENAALRGEQNTAMERFRSVAETCPKNYYFYAAAARTELGTKSRTPNRGSN